MLQMWQNTITSLHVVQFLAAGVRTILAEPRRNGGNHIHPFFRRCVKSVQKVAAAGFSGGVLLRALPGLRRPLGILLPAVPRPGLPRSWGSAFSFPPILPQ